MNSIFMKFAKVFAAVALMITAANVNTTCMVVIHQPKLPESADKLRKF